jgi:hypothetical protein
MDQYTYFLNMLYLENTLYSKHILDDILCKDHLDKVADKNSRHLNTVYLLRKGMDYMDQLLLEDLFQLSQCID